MFEYKFYHPTTVFNKEIYRPESQCKKNLKILKKIVGICRNIYYDVAW